MGLEGDSLRPTRRTNAVRELIEVKASSLARIRTGLAPERAGVGSAHLAHFMRAAVGTSAVLLQRKR
jgi:hypothetical protein